MAESEVKCRVYYTPINKENLQVINVKNEKDYNYVLSFIKEIIKTKIKKPSSENISLEDDEIVEFINKGLTISKDEAKKLFDKLSLYLYGPSKKEGKYWCLIVSEDYSFIYHFTPDESATFEDGNIKQYIKYLDDSTILKFILKIKSASLSKYFEELSEEELNKVEGVDEVFNVYDKSSTKAMKKLTGKEPEYEFKGELRIRIKRSDKTDIVIETYLEDIENINSNVYFDFENGSATIKIENAPITEPTVDGNKYDIITGIKKIEFESLEIGEFINKFNFYYDSKKDVEETKDYVKIEQKRINKPDKKWKNTEETIFILSNRIKDSKNITDSISNSITNNFNLSFVELNGFKSNYEIIDIGKVRFFCKIKDYDKVKFLKETFNKIIEKIGRNITLEKTIYFTALITLTNFFKSSGFREKLYTGFKNELINYYKNLPTENIELKEYDNLGIEFKGSSYDKRHQFFDPSPKKFSDKIIKKLKGKRNKLNIFFIGVNEDTKNFSPIPLSQIRNEFHDKLKEKLSNNKIYVYLSETIPINEKEGILILVLSKEK